MTITRIRIQNYFRKAMLLDTIAKNSTEGEITAVITFEEE